MREKVIRRDDPLAQDGAPYGLESCIAVTPAGGIPARSGDIAGKVTDASMCYIGDNGRIITTTDQLTIYNPFGSSVGGSAYVTCKFVNGIWIVDAEDC